MIIGIDGNEANIPNRVGINVYAFEIIRALHKIMPNWKEKHSLIVYLKNEPLEDMPKESDFFKYKVLKGSGMWILSKLTPYLLKTSQKPDVFFSPSHYLPPITSMPKVCTITDLGYLEFPGQFKKRDYWQLKYWSAISILVAKSIITISESSKKDIVRHYPFTTEKVNVTYLSYDKSRFNTLISNDDVRRIKNKHTIVNDYILFLSTLKPSKNIEGLLQAFKSVAEKYPEVSLVIAGKKGWLYESVFRKVKELNLETKVIFTGYIEELDKPGLIKGAKAFVLPSFWEGFGLDVLSAMACGVPVVVSDVGSLPEVVGDAGIYVDPKSPESIGKGLLKVLSMSKTEHTKLISAGLDQVKKFSWEDTARKTFYILETSVS